MLRPATPLTILMFVAFVLLVLATLSTPIVKAIPIASFNGVNFGVFGYCKGSTCSKITIGYSIDLKALMGDSNANADFTLPSSTRSSLSAILIVHPVAAALTLICFILSATAHLHSPSHSPKYLLALLILIIPTLLITLLAFLVDILLFVPHLAWGGWIVLVSTILILASGIVTCAMRRTLVSRKARKKRIAENAEMNGQNYYANQMAPPMTGPRAESPPPLASGAIGNSDRLPKFATFEDSKSAIVSEDRVPLNQRTPSNKTLPSMPNEGAPRYSEDTYDRFGGPGRGGPRGGVRGGNMRGGTRGGMYRGPPRDEYGNPMPPSNRFGPAPPAGLRRDPSAPARMGGHYPEDASAGPGFRGRGRGGYPPRGYGRGGPGSRGGGYGRGGMPMGAMAAGVGGGAMAADMRRGQPPPGYNNMYPPGGSSGRPGQYDGVGGPAGFGRSPSAPAYNGRRPSPGPPSAPGEYRRRSPGPPSTARGYNRGPSPGPPSAPGSYARGPSPGPPLAPGGYRYGTHDQGPPSPIQPYDNDSQLPPSAPGSYPPQDSHLIGQAVEMDAVHGSPSPVPGFLDRSPPILDENDDTGFANLQQPPKHRDEPMSMTSVYSSETPYVPPRAAWASSATTRGTTTTPLHNTAAGTNGIDPVELPVQSSLHDGPYNGRPQARSHNRNQSDNYYEDVDPRFAPTSEPNDYDTQKSRQTQSSNALPSNLMPGHRVHGPIHPTIEHNGEIVDPNDTYDDLMDGQRSPASDNSAMTSISQRGVNPNWRPGSTDGHGNLIVPQRRQQQQREILLNSNPDFGLNPSRAGGGRMPAGMGQAF